MSFPLPLKESDVVRSQPRRRNRLSSYKRAKAYGRRDLEADVAEIVGEVNAAAAPHVAEVAEGMVSRFGGVTGFCNFYYQQIMHAATFKPGSKAVLDACKAMTVLIATTSKTAPKAPNAEYMLEEDVRREAEELILKLFPHRQVHEIEDSRGNADQSADA